MVARLEERSGSDFGSFLRCEGLIDSSNRLLVGHCSLEVGHSGSGLGDFEGRDLRNHIYHGSAGRRWFV